MIIIFYICFLIVLITLICLIVCPPKFKHVVEVSYGRNGNFKRLEVRKGLYNPKDGGKLIHTMITFG